MAIYTLKKVMKRDYVGYLGINVLKNFLIILNATIYNIMLYIASEDYTMPLLFSIISAYFYYRVVFKEKKCFKYICRLFIIFFIGCFIIGFNSRADIKSLEKTGVNRIFNYSDYIKACKLDNCDLIADDGSGIETLDSLNNRILYMIYIHNSSPNSFHRAYGLFNYHYFLTKFEIISKNKDYTKEELILFISLISEWDELVKTKLRNTVFERSYYSKLNTNRKYIIKGIK